MLANTIGVAQGPFTLGFSLVHYPAVSPLSWDVQIDVARLDDVDFSSTIFSRKTSESQDGWYYIPVTGSSGKLTAWPNTGVQTSKDDAVDKSIHDDPPLPIVAQAFYMVSAPAELSRFITGETVLCRARQSYDGGTSWGDWSVWTVRI